MKKTNIFKWMNTPLSSEVGDGMVDAINVKFEHVRDAFLHLSDIFSETPIIYLGRREKEGRTIDVFGKFESAQACYTFKTRGAEWFVFNIMNQYLHGGRHTKPVLVAASAGNHAQGVALAAKRWGLEAHIFMPEGTPEVKLRRTSEELEAIVHQEGRSFDESLQAALEYAKPRGREFIHPYEHHYTIEGQGSVAMEILARLCPLAEKYWRLYDQFAKTPNWLASAPDIIIAGAGGGGLTSGMGVVARDFTKKTGHKVHVIGVQSENADSLYLSFHAGRLLPSTNGAASIADGIAVRQASEVMLATTRMYVDDMVLVSEKEIIEAMQAIRNHPSLQDRTWFHDEHYNGEFPDRQLPENQVFYSVERQLNIVEGAAAAAFAGVDKIDFHHLGIKKELVSVVCVLTGSNIDPKKWNSLTSDAAQLSKGF